MTAFSHWILSHKLVVLLAWIVIAVGGAAAVGPASRALTDDASLPNREGWATNATIARLYGADPGGSSPLLAVVTLPRGRTVRSPGVAEQLARIDGRLHAALPGARIASFASTGDSTFLSRDRRTVFALAYPRPDPDAQFGENPGAAQAARRALRGLAVTGRPVRLTGFDALESESGGSGGPGLLLEALIGGAGALLVLAFVFGSLLAVVPLLMAIVSILTSSCCCWDWLS